MKHTRGATRILSTLVLACLLPSTGAVAQAPPATTVLREARVFTADPERPWAEAVAVRGGRILAVGEEDPVLARAGEGAAVLELDGRLVVPGLNDAHVHLGASPPSTVLELGAGQGVAADPAWEEVRGAVAEAASSAPEGRWIRGTIGPSLLEDERATRFGLDSVAPGHPVLLVAASGHGTLVNTAALRELELPLDPEPSPGGWYRRVEGEGTITGVLREGAEIAARRRLHAMQGPAANAEEYRRVARDFVSWGVTSAQQHAASLPLDAAVEALRQAEVPVRWALYRWPLPEREVAEAWPAPERPAGDVPRVAVRGVKWMLDGTPLERDAVMREPYADRPGWPGRLNYTPDQVRAILAGGLEHGEQMAFHVAGDSTLALVLRTMGRLADPDTWRARRVRIEHGDGLMPDLVPLAAELGVVLVQNPLHFSGPSFEGRLGPERAAGFQPLRSAREAGIPLALGADAGGPARNPFLNMMLAARHPANPDEALSLEETLLAYTRGSARAEFAEDEKGVLAPGMLADLAVLSQDIFSVPLEALPGTRSVLTMIGGEIVHRAGGLEAAP